MVFNLSRYGLVAGSHCTDGKIQRNSLVRVKRGDKDIVFQGKVASLKHVKEDVREITAGFDCGIQFDGWTGFKQGDVVEAYELVQI
jgi:translation initiation factor IF-2